MLILRFLDSVVKKEKQKKFTGAIVKKGRELLT